METKKSKKGNKGKAIIALIVALLLCLVAWKMFYEPATLTGQILEEGTNTPVPGAIVKLIQENQVKYDTTTNEDGMYKLQDLEPGTYTIWVGKLLYDENSTQITIGRGYNSMDLELEPLTKVKPGDMINTWGYLVGRVSKLFDNTPIQGVQVTLYQGGKVKGYDLTDYNGNYNIENVITGVYDLGFFKKDYAPHITEITIIEGANTYDVQLAGQIIQPF